MNHSPIIRYGFLVLLVLVLAPLRVDAATVEGRVFDDGGPMTGAKVSVYKNLEEFNTGKPFITSAETDTEGFYKFQAPEGGYYFTARGKKNGKDFFSYHGSNPITIGSEGAWLVLLANEVKPPVYSEGAGALNGVVTMKGQPVGDAYISLYTPDTKRLRGLGIRTESVNPDGTFSLSQPAGKYIVVAKKMEGGKTIRPLRKGDLFCYYPLNPVEVRSDKAVRIEVPCYPKDERDAFVEWRPKKPKDFPTVEQIAERAKFGIKGRVRDVAGKPAAGLHVLAYRSEGPVLMLYHLSHGTEYLGQTDGEGRYFIPMNADGDYYVIARSSLGGTPHEKETYGIYGGKTGNAVHYAKGRVLDNVDIVAGTVMSESGGYAPKNVDEIKNSEYKTDAALDKDTLWKGTITINGKVLVKKGVTLTIEPGTIVRFRKVDADNNGIGDGEVVVEGRIIARGTSGSRILFTSAEKKPEVKDWSYVMLLATGADSVFEYCEFQYAFSALQVLFSSAQVTDCLFTKNHEGMRYNRSNLVIQHCSFTDNAIGFRFARLEGAVVVRDNIVTANDVGALYMQPQQKTVDFELDAAPSDYKLPLIVNNNIFGNRDYNFKVGERKAIDLDFPDNWWGSTTKEGIAELIFDRAKDDSLGEVKFMPFLSAPVQDAGVREKAR